MATIWDENSGDLAGIPTVDVGSGGGSAISESTQRILSTGGFSGTADGSQPGTTYKQPTGSVVTNTYTPPKTAMPGVPSLPAVPQPDEAKYKGYRQQAFSPYYRAAQQGLRTGLARHYYKGNPIAAAEEKARLLREYGTTLSQGQAQAGREALSRQEQDLARQMQAWQAQVQLVGQKYQASLQAWTKSGTETQTSKSTYGSTGVAGTKGQTGVKEVYGIGGYHSYTKPTIWG